MNILINKNSNRVEYITEKQLVNYSKNLILAEVEILPESFDYLTAENIREVTDRWTEKKIVEDYDENGNLVVNEVELERSKTYNTCDVKACFIEAKEESQAVKDIKRNKKIVSIIRKRYSVDDELAILRQKDDKPEKFLEYYNYAQSAINSVPKQN